MFCTPNGFSLVALLILCQVPKIHCSSRLMLKQYFSLGGKGKGRRQKREEKEQKERGRELSQFMADIYHLPDF